jgi:hypothetical protein
MATYVIETYLSRTSVEESESEATRLKAAAAGAAGAAVRYLRSYFVADDELCFHLIEAPSVAAATSIAARAGLAPERIVEAEATG